MSFQPVQMQMMAYQPVLQSVQPVVQQVQPVLQSVQPVVQQLVQRPVQQVAVQQFAQPQAAPQSANTCNLPQVCQDLKTLKERVEKLAQQIEDNDLAARIAKNEEAVQKLEEASNLQTEILKDMKTFLEQQHPSE